METSNCITRFQLTSYDERVARTFNILRLLIVEEIANKYKDRYLFSTNEFDRLDKINLRDSSSRAFANRVNS